MKPDGSDVQAPDPLRRLRRALARRWATGRSSTSTRWTSGRTTSPRAATSRWRSSCPSDRLQVREKFVDPNADLQRVVALEGRRAHRSRGARRRVRGPHAQEGPHPPHHREQPRPHPNSRPSRPDGKTIAAWTEVDGEEQLLLHAADNGAPPKTLGQRSARLALRARLVAGRQGASPGATRSTSSTCRRGHRRKHRRRPERLGDSTLRLVAGQPLPGVRRGPPEPLRPGAGSGTAQAKKAYAATDPVYNSSSPAWDPKGKYLFFLSDRFINPYLDRFEARFIVNEATLPFVVALQADGALPFAPRGDVDPRQARREEGREGRRGEGKDAKATRRRSRRRPRRRSSRSASTSTGWPVASSRSPSEPGNYDRAARGRRQAPLAEVSPIAA